jgi:hypothetical protein
VAGRTGCPRCLAVSLVACEATESFVHTHGGAIVPRANIRRSQWRVALIAESLPDVGADMNRTVAILHGRKRKPLNRYVVELPTIEQCERGPRDLLARTWASGLPHRTH